MRLESRDSGIVGACPEVQPPQWGTVKEKARQDGILRIVYSCEPGRKLKGHKIATCTADGWDHPVPKCVPRKKSLIRADRNDESRRERDVLNSKLEHSPIEINRAWIAQNLFSYMIHIPRCRVALIQLTRLAPMSHYAVCPLCVDNTLRRFRNDLYLGDQPIVPDRSKLQIAKDGLKALERIDDLKKRRKTKEGKRRKKKRKRPAKSSSRLPTATRLNETVVSQLDISCFARKSLGKGLIKAPLIEHARPAKYASNGTWLGRRPKCLRDTQLPTDKMKRCDQGTGECEHVCEDTPSGIKCSCFDGFRAKGPSCIDVNECEATPKICAENTECENTVGSYKCIIFSVKK
ncbi:Fibrillin-1 [Temnothorax longispinosus]|uniref:Fibrillin-1 n=1 Tax=Temnothorax longispinosus TaxID=300112 RepID=A0A4S2KVF9_9HYME|nr:Fibrillin-1 [Temnothorax longispinosus]